MKPRKQIELDEALCIISGIDRHESRIQLDVISNKKTEVAVMKEYITDMPEDVRNVDDYYIARDAALYVFGKLDLSDIIPYANLDDPESFDVPADPLPEDVSDPLIEQLIRRIQRLEAQVRILKTAHRQKQCKNVYVENGEKLMNQTEAFNYIGCSQLTIVRWTKQNLIPSYRKGNRVYYKKSELDESPVAINFKNIKRESNGRNN